MDLLASEAGALEGEHRYLVQPVLKAMQVLQIVCEAAEPPNLNQLARIAALPKTTVFRYLRTLAAMRLVEHDAATDRYRPGLGLWRLSQAGNSYEALRQTCRPAMTRLRQRFNETVNLGILSGGEVLYLDVVESDRSLRMQSTIGAADPLHSTALGKVFLAFRPSAQARALLPATLERRTRHTIVDADELLQQCETIRSVGYAMEVGENEEGSYCVAAPILDRHGTAVAAISLSAPVSRLNERVRHSVCTELTAACAEVSSDLLEPSPRQGRAEQPCRDTA